MKNYSGIDYKQRPKSYWRDRDVLSALLRNVKGTERREMIRCYWKQGRLDELHEAFLQDTLSEEQRERFGRIHPMFMGGEYLPDFQASEVEIARIELQSTTRDVISIRARKCGQGIGYRVVDEYNTDFSLARDTSARPLSLEELVEFLDNTTADGLPGGLGLGYNEMNAESCSRDYLRHFTRVTSEFYPNLHSHYERVFADWVAEEERERRLQEEQETE